MTSYIKVHNPPINHTKFPLVTQLDTTYAVIFIPYPKIKKKLLSSPNPLPKNPMKSSQLKTKALENVAKVG